MTSLSQDMAEKGIDEGLFVAQLHMEVGNFTTATFGPNEIRYAILYGKRYEFSSTAEWDDHSMSCNGSAKPFDVYLITSELHPVRVCRDFAEYLHYLVFLKIGHCGFKTVSSPDKSLTDRDRCDCHLFSQGKGFVLGEACAERFKVTMAKSLAPF